jgi:lipoprotein-releasing system ATP-binding protein
MNKPNYVLECDHLSRTFKDGKLKVEVLKNINLQITQGEQVAIVGASGAGKSTLLHLLGGLDKPTVGNVHVAGFDINKLSEKKRSQLRNKTLGFVYQFHHLLPEFTVLENVCMPLLIAKEKPDIARLAAENILDKVGLSHRLEHKLGELSGGERQRTAIARALVNRPLCVLADEPTGNLDHNTATKVYEAMLELNRELGTSLVIATHDQTLSAKMDRTLIIENGILQL